MLCRACCLLALLLLPPAAARAQEEDRALARFLDERTVAVLRLRPGKADLPGLLDRLAGGVGRWPASWREELLGVLGGLRAAGAGRAYVVASLADWAPFVVVPAGPGVDATRAADRLAALRRLDGGVRVKRVGPAVVAGTAEALRRLEALEPVARPDVTEALGKPGRGPARLVLVPTTDSRRILEEALPNLPAEVGGGPVAPLSRGLRWLTADLEATAPVSVRVAVQASGVEAAGALDRLARRGLAALAASGEVKEAFPEVGKAAGLWKPAREGDRLVLTLDEEAVAGLLGPQLARWREAEERGAREGRLKKVLEAMLAYEGKHGTFPARASYAGDGKPLLSWRVHLLPYLGEEALYREFRLGEPWDSDHNLKLLERMPAVYRPASAALAAAHKTTWLVPAGEATMFPGRRGVRVAEVTDGLANTALVVDAADEQAVEWTRPADLAYEEKQPTRGLAVRHGGRLLVGLASGGVLALPAGTDAATLRGLFTRSGGETLTLPPPQ